MKVSFADLCARIHRTLDAYPKSSDTELLVIYGTTPIVQRAVKAVRRTNARAIWHLPSDSITREQAWLLGGPRASEVERTRLFLEWVYDHSADRPPPWFCPHAVQCPTIRGCLDVDRSAR